MTIQTIDYVIDAAFAARRLQAPTFTCACCGLSGCTNDDSMDACDAVGPRMREKIVTEFGVNVCVTCAEDMTVCPQTGRAVHPDYGWQERDRGGDLFTFYDADAARLYAEGFFEDHGVAW